MILRSRALTVVALSLAVALGATSCSAIGELAGETTGGETSPAGGDSVASDASTTIASPGTIESIDEAAPADTPSIDPPSGGDAESSTDDPIDDDAAPFDAFINPSMMNKDEFPAVEGFVDAMIDAYGILDDSDLEACLEARVVDRVFFLNKQIQVPAGAAPTLSNNQLLFIEAALLGCAPEEAASTLSARTSVDDVSNSEYECVTTQLFSSFGNSDADELQMLLTGGSTEESIAAIVEAAQSVCGGSTEQIYAIIGNVALPSAGAWIASQTPWIGVAYDDDLRSCLTDRELDLYGPVTVDTTVFHAGVLVGGCNPEEVAKATSTFFKPSDDEIQIPQEDWECLLVEAYSRSAQLTAEEVLSQTEATKHDRQTACNVSEEVIDALNG